MDAVILLLTIAAGVASSFAAYWFGRVSAVNTMKALTAKTPLDDTLPEAGSNVMQLKSRGGG